MKDKQRGASFLGWVLVLAMISVVGLLTARLVPPYIDFRTIGTLIEALPPDQVRTMSKLEIRDALQKRFLINNIRDMKVADILDIQKRRDGTVLLLNYEVREHLAYNVSVVIEFNRTFTFE